MNFQDAVKEMKQGNAVAMKSWNYPLGTSVKILPIPTLPEVNDFYIKLAGSKLFSIFCVSYTAFSSEWVLVKE